MLVEFLLAALGVTGSITAALAFYFWYQGGSDITFDTGAARDFQIQADYEKREITCRCRFPLINRGRQQGMVLNAFCQPMYCGRIMNSIEILPKLRLLKEPLRQDGYWEAVLLKPDHSFPVEMQVRVRSQHDLSLVVKEIPRLSLVIYFQTVGREGIRWRLAEVGFNLSTIEKERAGQS